MLRPLSGSDCTVLPEMTSPTVADSVWRTGAPAVTSTVSSSAPSSILKSRRAICLASSWMALVVVVLKLWSSALTT
jgi:hypothetical protein